MNTGEAWDDEEIYPMREQNRKKKSNEGKSEMFRCFVRKVLTWDCGRGGSVIRIRAPSYSWWATHIREKKEGLLMDCSGCDWSLAGTQSHSFFFLPSGFFGRACVKYCWIWARRLIWCMEFCFRHIVERQNMIMERKLIWVKFTFCMLYTFKARILDLTYP